MTIEKRTGYSGMSFWLKLFKSIRGVFVIAAAVALLAMMVITVANIGARGLFASPILGAVEIPQLCGVIFVTFVVGYAQFQRRNIAVRIVVNKLPERFQLILSKVTLFLSLGIVAALVVACAWAAWSAVVTGEYTGTLAIKLATFRFIWVIGWIALWVILLGHLFETQVKREKK